MVPPLLAAPLVDPKAALLRKGWIAGGLLAGLLLLVALVAGYRASGGAAPPVRGPGPAPEPAAAEAPRSALASADSRGFLYGRVTTVEGGAYEGRLRFGVVEEAFWSDYFNGAKADNPWAAQVSPERRPRERLPIAIFGFEIGSRTREVDLGRLFMARFGDLARIEAAGTDVRVTTKSGSVVVLDRLEAGDFDDGVRVWDAARGAVDLDSLRIRAIDFLPTPALGALPGRLHGRVRTRQGELTGFLQWDREEGLGSDLLEGESAGGALALRFDALRAIARESGESCRATLADGREVVLAGTTETGEGHRGIYVDDPRYGRVLVSWEAFERVDFDDFAAIGSGPGYDDFPPGRPLTGAVTTRDGRRLTGRLVYDLDESETTETLDAPRAGVDYTIPFGRIAAILPAGPDGGDGARARVTLASGETLELEAAGDLGARNAGLLLFAEGPTDPEYLPWNEVERIDFDRAPTESPPPGGGQAAGRPF